MDLSQLASGVATTTDPEQRRLLYAARDEFIAHGFRRTSVGDIARRANVSRPTVYRRLGDKDEIVRAVVFTEVIEFFASISAEVLTKTMPADRAVEAFVRGIRACRTNPLVTALQQFEPDTFASLVSSENAASMEAVRMAIASVVTGPAMPFDAALRAADLMVRVAASLLIAPSAVVPVDTDERARWFAVTYLVPLIEAAALDGPP
ncbi:TetR/AcrR family transcriptional regulator [Mycolicibacter kumamotonensis]|uniref:HTH tetR-type domain-containing protein n=1 Tax=Mycolicibacter kumamotonensis TaxID=354243 RepID=A0A1B8SI15_9MYCO|nr:TetR/AcrR family transcriptional regulator [Mycolicibacter kumamotonensis]OBY32380.1 hypothetical protein ACT18_07765 [Mycolicibacter kumamotonensis]